MNVTDLVQNTAEWKQARCGSLGASQVADALACTKSGWGSSRANLMAQLIVERLTGVPTEGYMNDAMRWGVENEPYAKAAYSFRTDKEIVDVGLIRHPIIERTHASPDGLIDDDGLIEIKAPLSATHLDYLLTGSIPGKYLTQAAWQLSCSGRQYCDFVSFDPRFPENMRLFVRRIERNDVQIAELEHGVIEFIGELDHKIAVLTEMYLPVAELRHRIVEAIAEIVPGRSA